jgi:hypothetical protein
MPVEPKSSTEDIKRLMNVLGGMGPNRLNILEDFLTSLKDMPSLDSAMLEELLVIFGS